MTGRLVAVDFNGFAVIMTGRPVGVKMTGGPDILHFTTLPVTLTDKPFETCFLFEFFSAFL